MYFNGKTNWQVLGSKKPEHEAYKLHITCLLKKMMMMTLLEMTLRYKNHTFLYPFSNVAVQDTGIIRNLHAYTVSEEYSQFEKNKKKKSKKTAKNLNEGRNLL